MPRWVGNGKRWLRLRDGTRVHGVSGSGGMWYVSWGLVKMILGDHCLRHFVLLIKEYVGQSRRGHTG